MKTTTKNNIKLFFKSWINNAACVEGGRHKPWYPAAIILFCSTILALVPIFVKAITTQGDSSISSNSYGIEVPCERFLEDINEKKIEMGLILKDDGSKELNVDSSVWNAAYETTKDSVKNKYAVYQHKDYNGKVDMEFFFVNEFTEEFLNDINYVVTVSEDGKETKTSRTSSYTVFSKKSYLTYIVNPVTKAGVVSIPGDYSSFALDYTINSINGRKTLADTLDPTKTPDYEAFLKLSWENWKSFYVVGYNNTRLTVTWQTTLISAAIDVGLTAFFGLMVWVITRGKNNPFRVYTVWESQKIAWWAALAPAILACGLGFLFANFAAVVYPLLYGVRVMWLSMKTLRPENVPAK